MNKSNNKLPLQFTELAQDDILTHVDLYINLLVDSALKCSLPSAPSGTYERIYYEYAIKEAQKADKLFQKTFK